MNDQIWEWTEKELSPPGIRQPGRRSLFRIGARVGQQIADDIARSKRQFFAYLASDLATHGESSGIPRLPFSSDPIYRQRLGRASSILNSTGELAPLQSFLNSYIPNRWRLMDAPRGYFRVGSGRVGMTPIGCPPAVVVYVTDLKPG